jgi:phage baseplate assembly protein W
MYSERAGHLWPSLGLVPPNGNWLSAGDLAEHVRQSVFLLLTVQKGERALAPAFGNGLREFMFLPNTPSLRERLGTHLQKIVCEQEPRARDVEVEVLPISGQPTQVEIHVKYRVISAQRKSSVQVRYDLQGGHLGSHA